MEFEHRIQTWDKFKGLLLNKVVLYSIVIVKRFNMMGVGEEKPDENQ